MVPVYVCVWIYILNLLANFQEKEKKSDYKRNQVDGNQRNWYQLNTHLLPQKEKLIKQTNDPNSNQQEPTDADVTILGQLISAKLGNSHRAKNIISFINVNIQRQR